MHALLSKCMSMSHAMMGSVISPFGTNHNWYSQRESYILKNGGGKRDALREGDNGIFWPGNKGELLVKRPFLP